MPESHGPRVPALRPRLRCRVVGIWHGQPLPSIVVPGCSSVSLPSGRTTLGHMCASKTTLTAGSAERAGAMGGRPGGSQRRGYTEAESPSARAFIKPGCTGGRLVWAGCWCWGLVLGWCAASGCCEGAPVRGVWVVAGWWRWGCVLGGAGFRGGRLDEQRQVAQVSQRSGVGVRPGPVLG